MLIRAIRAENFLGFESVLLEDLPEQGLIALEGPNESGKSAVGQLILFALFGRVSSRSEIPLAKLIRWGAETLRVEVELSEKPIGGSFSVDPDAGRYLVFREVDRHGASYAKVLNLPCRSEAAVGARAVSELLASHLRLDLSELEQSFFGEQWADRGSVANPTGFFEAAMGLRHLRLAMNEVRREATPLERKCAQVQRELGQQKVQIEKLRRSAEKIPELTARLARASEQHQERSRRFAELRRKLDQIKTDAGQIEARARRIEQLRDASFVAVKEEVDRIPLGAPASLRGERPEDESLRGLLASSVAGLDQLRAFAADCRAFVESLERDAVDASDELSPEDPARAAGRLADLTAAAQDLTRKMRLRRALCGIGGAGAAVLGALAVLAAQGQIKAPPGWTEAFASTFPLQLGGGAGGLAVAALCGLASVSRLGRKRQELGQCVAACEAQVREATEAVRALSAIKSGAPLKSLPRFLEAAASSSWPSAVESARAFCERHEGFTAGGGEQGLERKLSALARTERDLRARLLADGQRLEKQLQEEDGQLKRSAGEKERLENDLRECQLQSQRHESLAEKCLGKESEALAFQHSIEEHLFGVRLLEWTVAAIHAKVGPALTRFLKELLPRLTGGRYRDVRVEADGSVRVFSSEKSDFLEAEELSGGVREALFLALRLAISHAFACARTRQAQFLFLDEPFTTLDPTRRLEVLRLLPRLSPGLSQFFITQSELSTEARALFDHVVRLPAAAGSPAEKVVAAAPPVSSGEPASGRAGSFRDEGTSSWDAS